ncbi:lysozyme [Aquamicrobium sp.]|uniref:lysozyme n=1 Tax=Aquamicrobium sp. TaxID=1872579 RepID=UPI002587069E|nr:lysozyme [Aquamicrobium sp.]MCK9549142.1 lysozyme [Aquamicrobium sp.]
MAKLPSRESLGGMPSARSGRAIATIDATAPARAMQRFGRTIAGAGQEIGDAILKLSQDPAAEYETERRFQEFKFQQQQQLEERMRSVQPGQADGFADTWADGYGEQARGFFETVPDRLKPKYDNKLFGVERDFYRSAATFSRNEQKRFSLANLDDDVKRLALTPDLDTARADFDSLINLNPYLTPIEKDEVRRKGLDVLEEQNLEWRIRRGDDLDEIIRDLETGGMPDRDPAGRVSENGLDFIRKQEGFTPVAKWDFKQHSVGYGTRGKPGERITVEEAERRLHVEAGAVSDWIEKKVKVPLSQEQHDALVSFGFNLGTGNLEKLLPDLNEGNFERVAERMLSFNKAGGRTQDGLRRRRQEEAMLFLSSSEPMQVAQAPTAGDGARLPSLGKYPNLSPQRRSALINKARVARSAITQQELRDDEERIRRTGEPLVGPDGKTSLDRAKTFLTKNQVDQARISWDEARMEYEAISPLRSLSELEDEDGMSDVDRHIAALSPDEKAPEESYASRARVLDKTLAAWKKIQEERRKDPAKAVNDQPEVRDAFEVVQARVPEATIVQHDDGELDVEVAEGQPAVSALKAQEMVMEARLQAQARLGIPEVYRSPITRKQAKKLLDMPDPALLNDKEFYDKLRAAADASEETYGPRFGRQAFESAVRFKLREKEHKDTAAGVIRQVVWGEPVTQRDINRLRMMNEIDLSDAMFSDPFAFTGPRSTRGGVRQIEDLDAIGRGPENQFLPAFAMEETERPFISPEFARDTMPAIQEYQARQAAKRPTPAQIEWVRQDPKSRQPIFDMEFGRGAWARFANEPADTSREPSR